MTRLASQLRRYLPALTEQRTDGELLAAFLHDRDEAAFAELLRRHGPLVWAACRRLLPDHADAEDAFQAAFLVLVRQARRLTGQAAIGPWLYKVAAWTARNIRRRNARTLARRVPLSPDVPESSPGIEASEMRIDLDAALLALPEKYRAALVLCHLQGLSRREAAARLGCPEGTLSSLLSRGLERLRAKLAGRDPTAALMLPILVVPTVLVSTTARAAATAQVAAAGAFSISVSQLAEGVLRMFWVKKATAASVALFAVFAFGVGVGMGVRYGPATSAGDGAAPPGVETKPVTAVDLDQQIAELKKEINAARKVLEFALKGVEYAEKKLELAIATKDPKAIEEDRAVLERFKVNVADAEKRLVILKAMLGELEAKKKSGSDAQSKPTLANADDIELQLRKAVDELARLRSESDQLKLKGEEFKQRAAVIDAQTRRLMVVINELEALRKRDTLKTAPKAPSTGLVVVVHSGLSSWPCVIKESDVKTGKLVGTLTCDNTDILRVALTRTMNDPKGPHDLAISIQEGATVDRIKSVIEACKAAGFKQARVSGALPRDGLGIMRYYGTISSASWKQYHDELLTLDEILDGRRSGKELPKR